MGGEDNLLLPDVVLRNDKTKEIYLIEGKMYNKLADGLSDIMGYDAIENEHIKRSYPGYTISRWITLFGGNGITIPHEKVLILCNNSGKVIINQNAPQAIIEAFRTVGIY